MILTGPEIEQQVSLGKISLSGFRSEHVGPNSYDLTLSPRLLAYGDGAVLDMRKENPPTETFSIPPEGFVLQPGKLYLACTNEVVGSDWFVPMVEGRSSVGRLGMQVHVTAGFMDLGFKGTVTLEVTVVHPVRIYADVRVCQVYFLTPRGERKLYTGRYQGQIDPTESRFNL